MSEPTREERIEAIQGRVEAFTAPRAERPVRDDLEFAHQACKDIPFLLKELAEARERATAAEAERDARRRISAQRSEMHALERQELETAHADFKTLSDDHEQMAIIVNQLRAELERACCSIREMLDTPGVQDDIDFRKRNAAMGVAEEPTGGKPE